MMDAFGGLGNLLDAWANDVLVTPRKLASNQRRNGDAAIAFATDVSRALFGAKHSRASAQFLEPMMTPTAGSATKGLGGRQIHLAIGVAAAELLERDHLGAFLSRYCDSGLDLRYFPISVSRLRVALDVVLAPFSSAKRLRLLAALAEECDLELLRSAPTNAAFASTFVARYAQHPSPAVRRLATSYRGRSEDEQMRYATADDVCQRHGIALAPDVLPSVQAVLASDSSVRIRRALASNRSTTLLTQARLLADSNPEVRSAQDGARRVGARCDGESGATPLGAANAIDDAVLRLRVALDPRASDRARILEHPAARALSIAHYAIVNGFAPPGHLVKDVASLPGIDDLPFPAAVAAQQRLAVIDPQVRVMRNGRELRANGRMMANCFVGDRYHGACRSGTTVVACFRVATGDAPVRYNAMWERESSTWQFVGVVGPNLDGDIPSAAYERIVDFTAALATMPRPSATTRLHADRLRLQLPLIPSVPFDR